MPYRELHRQCRGAVSTMSFVVAFLFWELVGFLVVQRRASPSCRRLVTMWSCEPDGAAGGRLSVEAAEFDFPALSWWESPLPNCVGGSLAPYPVFWPTTLRDTSAKFLCAAVPVCLLSLREGYDAIAVCRAN